MAHYAFIDDTNTVVEIITGVDENETDNLPSEFSSWEEFYSNRHGKTCLRTSYNTRHNQHHFGGTPYRGNYAGIGFTYDEVNDVFLPEKIYDSWVIDETLWDWVSPIGNPPDDGMHYQWNEEAYQADNTTGWELIPEER